MVVHYANPVQASLPTPPKIRAAIPPAEALTLTGMENALSTRWLPSSTSYKGQPALTSTASLNELTTFVCLSVLLTQRGPLELPMSSSRHAILSMVSDSRPLTVRAKHGIVNAGELQLQLRAVADPLG